MEVLGSELWPWLVQKAACGGVDQPFRVLDVGANNGTLTELIRTALLEQGGAAAVDAWGVDIDAGLIACAQAQFPECRFVTCDFVMGTPANVKGPFELVCCFGTTMWVHLNNGDEGLRCFLERLADSARTAVILEPQRWRSYHNARKRVRREKLDGAVPRTFFELRIGSNDELERLIDEVMLARFADKRALGTTGNWERTILVFSGRRAPGTGAAPATLAVTPPPHKEVRCT
jgi:SAM-dependent methyltransferase